MCCSSDDHLPISDVIAEVTRTAAIRLSSVRGTNADDVDMVEMCSKSSLDHGSKSPITRWREMLSVERDGLSEANVAVHEARFFRICKDNCIASVLDSAY